MERVYCSELNNVDAKSAPELDIVFVHGLSSSADAAWKNSTEDLWPLWLKQIFKNTRVILLNYPAPTFFTSAASAVTIQERARNLADFLPTIGIGNRPTIFICHSLGGIIIKEIIRSCVDTGCALNIAAHTIGIVFLATPHGGSKIANWTDLIGSSITADLAHESDYCKELRTWFAEYAGQKAISLSAYYEMQTYKKLIFVEKDSADPHCRNCNTVGLDANHSTISKPVSPNDDLFLRLVRDIEVAKMRVEQMSKQIATIQDVLLLPDLTNKMYFDVINFLNILFSNTARRCIIISNPCGGPKPCSIIITKDEEVIRDITPLQERFPDRFSVHFGSLGEFTSDTNIVLRSFDAILSALKKIVAWELKIKASIAFKVDEEILVLTAAHLIDGMIHQIASKFSDEWKDDEADGKSTSQGTAVGKYFSSLSNSDRQECLRVLKTELYSKEFQTSLFSYRSKTYERKFLCEMKWTDFRNDAVIVSFKNNIDENRGLEAWCRDNLSWIENIADLRAPFVGDTCTTPEEPNIQLKIERVDETVLIPIHDKVTMLRNIIVLSGAAAKKGSSGAPIFDSVGNIVGMIVGRSHDGGEPKYLAINVPQILGQFTEQRKTLTVPIKR